MSLEASPEPQRTCVWLTGLSGSGKSTTATALAQRLEALGYAVQVFDGDAVRARLSPSLGFSRQDREANVLRVAHLASEAMDQGAIAICALISPYRDSRQQARAVIGSAAFIEVFVDTPLALCEARDVKGLYRRAREGAISGVTGIDDPYEPPVAPDLTLLTAECTLEENVRLLLKTLEQRGAIRIEVDNAQLPAGTGFSRPH